MHRSILATFLIVLTALLLCICFPHRIAIGQESRDLGGLELGPVSAGPNAGVRPGSPYFVRVRVSNTSAIQKSGKIVCKFSEYPSEETAYAVQLAAGQSRIFELPLLVPKKLNAEVLHIQVLLLGTEGGREVILEKKGKPMTETLVASVGRESIVAAMAVEPESRTTLQWRWPNYDLYESVEMVLGAKVGAGYSRRMLRIEEEGLPDAMAWDVVDCLVLADESMLANPVNQSMLKRWILGGGRLWVMLDRVRSEYVTPLLELDQLIATLDETELMSGVVETINSPSLPKDQRLFVPKDQRLFDSVVPLRLKRITQIGGSVTHLLEGWPLAVWYPVGRGEVLVTTMSPRGWIQPRKLTDETTDEKRTAFQIRPWGLELGPRFFQSRASSRIVSSMIDSNYPLRQIGNPIISKSIVSWALGSFVGILCGFGLYQWRFGSSSRMGWMAPLLSGLGCVPIVLASLWVRSEIFETSGRLQFVDVAPDGASANIRETTAVYLNDSTNMQLESEIESRVEPIASADLGVRQWIWSDMQKWSWSSQNWPTGVWRALYGYSRVTQGLVVNGSLHEDGLHLQVPASLPTPLEDPILSFERGTQSLCKSLGDRMWGVDSSQIAEGDRWVTGTLISDEQLRRVEIYQAVFEKNKGIESRNRRVLYGFTDLWSGGPEWDRSLINRGSALVSMPIRLHRPKVGSKIQIPHSLLTGEALHEGGVRTTAFNQDTGRWVLDAPSASTARVRYRVPPEVLPLQITSLKIELMTNAPQRTFTLSRFDKDKMEEVVRLESPSIPWSKTFTATSDLPKHTDGYVDFQVMVSARLESDAGFDQVVNWGIEYLRVQINGVVLSPGAAR